MSALHLIHFFLFLLSLMPTTTCVPAPPKPAGSNLSPPNNLILPSNLTLPHAIDQPLRYHIPNTRTNLFLTLGFPLNATALRYATNSARHYISQEIEHGAHGAIPLTDDPFIEDLGWGAKITVVSSRPDKRVTWKLLGEVFEGLWEVLVVAGRNVEVEFEVYRGRLEMLARGRVEGGDVEPERR